MKLFFDNPHYGSVPFCIKSHTCRRWGTECAVCEDCDSNPRYDHVYSPEDFKSIGETKTFSYRYDSAAGGEESYLMAFAIRKSGEVIEMDYADSFESPASDVQSYEEDEESVPSIAEQVAMLGDVVGVIIISESDCSWQDQEDWCLSFHNEEGEPELPDLGNGMGYVAYCPVKPIDWVKVRRRLEDAIRKDGKLMRKLAAVAGIRIW